MNKNIKKLILSAFVLSTVSMPVFAGLEYDAGMRAYNKGDFKFAKTLFLKAIEKDYYDVNSRYMYTQILMKEKQYDTAKAQYQIIIKSAPASKAAKLSQQGIANIQEYNRRLAEEKAALAKANAKEKATTDKKAQTTKSIPQSAEAKKLAAETNYVKNAYRSGKKYTRPTGVIRVYIPNDQTFKPLMKQAYKEWSNAIGNSVSFSFVNSPSVADDKITFIKLESSGSMQQAGNCQYSKIEGSNLLNNDITIAAYAPNGKPLPQASVYHVMLHEIGHSIGIMGHSTNPDDIMAQGADKVIAHLSQRDKNTAKILYRSYGSQPDANSIKQAKEAELKDIANRISTSSASLIDLGDEYLSQGKYNQALEAYKKAEKIQAEPTVYWRLVKAYQKLHDSDNEASYYKKILAIDTSNVTALYNLLVIYRNQYRLEEGQQLLKDFLSKNPSAMNNADIIKLSDAFSDKNIQRIKMRQKFVNATNKKYR